MKKILILEDSFIVSKLLKTVLTAKGFDITLHETIKSALSDNSIYHFAILDYKLPDGNGTEVAKNLKLRNPSIPIILLTARGSEEVKKEAKLSGVNEFLEKPVDTNTLMNIINTYLN